VRDKSYISAVHIYLETANIMGATGFWRVTAGGGVAVEDTMK
jgi:hypothetical protein